jgi:hypothetical protein
MMAFFAAPSFQDRSWLTTAAGFGCVVSGAGCPAGLSQPKSVQHSTAAAKAVRVEAISSSGRVSLLPVSTTGIARAQAVTVPHR